MSKQCHLFSCFEGPANLPHIPHTTSFPDFGFLASSALQTDAEPPSHGASRPKQPNLTRHKRHAFIMQREPLAAGQSADFRMAQPNNQLARLARRHMDTLSTSTDWRSSTPVPAKRRPRTHLPAFTCSKSKLHCFTTRGPKSTTSGQLIQNPRPIGIYISNPCACK